MSTKPAPRPGPQNPLADDILAGLDGVFGLHPGFRAVHAKGVLCGGTFFPAEGAKQLTRAPHILREETPVTVRLSDFAGVPTIPDNDPNGAGPRGCAVRFHLGEHEHTDIVAHSANGFPVHTGEEFLGFVKALATSGPNAPKPTPLDAFLAANPAAMRFATTPKPIPTSFAHEAFFGVSALKFTNANGESRFGRYRIRPEAGTEYLSTEDAAKKSSEFLFEEFEQRMTETPITYRLFVQIAEPGDDVNDATNVWPETRTEIELGSVVLISIHHDPAADFRKMIFDPIPRVDGIEPSDDPLWNLRADIYLLSGRRRRKASGL
jgi:catalase